MVKSYQVHIKNKTESIIVKDMPIRDADIDNHKHILNRCRKYLKRTEANFKDFVVVKITVEKEKLGI